MARGFAHARSPRRDSFMPVAASHASIGLISSMVRKCHRILPIVNSNGNFCVDGNPAEEQGRAMDADMTDGKGRRVAIWLAHKQSSAFLREAIRRGERTAECWAELKNRRERVNAAMAIIHGPDWRPTPSP